MPRRASMRPSGQTGASKITSSSISRAIGVAAARAVPSAIANIRTGGFGNIENKFVDYRVSGDAFTTSWAGGEMEDGTALSLSAVAQGDGESERDGRVYTINSVHIKGFLETPLEESQAAPEIDYMARLALVWDTQTNAVQLSAEDVFLTVAAGEDTNSFRNLQYSKRFIVLKDKTWRLAHQQVNEGAANLFATGGIRIPFKMNKSFKNGIKVRCTGTTAVIASIADNSLHLIGVSNSGQAVLTYQSRVRFTG